MRTVVSGMIAAVPCQGGATWAVLQYLLGLARLGHPVSFVEALDGDAIAPKGAPLGESRNARYCAQVLREHGLGDSWALLRRGTRDTAGLSYSALEQVARDADLLLDISGTLGGEEAFRRVPTRVYLDVDPVFTQLWAAQGIDMRLDGHTHFVTVGLSLPAPESTVPTGEQDWIATRQPVVLDQWPVSQEPPRYGFTTVANWRGYGSVEHDGVRYGQKVHSLRPFLALPTRTEHPLLLALAIDEGEVADLAALRDNGWRLADPAAVAGTPAAYRRFVQQSTAELGIAKSGYVISGSGWFSDRSICYLASGRPVLAQETGFSDHLPTGEGLLAFETVDDALSGIERIHADYRHHAGAARALAVEHFDSDRVLSGLLREVGAG